MEKTAEITIHTFWYSTYSYCLSPSALPLSFWVLSIGWLRGLDLGWSASDYGDNGCSGQWMFKSHGCPKWGYMMHGRYTRTLDTKFVLSSFTTSSIFYVSTILSPSISPNPPLRTVLLCRDLESVMIDKFIDVEQLEFIEGVVHRKCCFDKVGCLVCWHEVCSPKNGVEMDNSQMPS